MEVFVNVPLKLVTFVPPSPPVILLVKLGALQLYVVPEGIVIPVGVKLNGTPEQVLSDIAFIFLARGNTPNVSVNPEEVHPPGTTGVIK